LDHIKRSFNESKIVARGNVAGHRK